MEGAAAKQKSKSLEILQKHMTGKFLSMEIVLYFIDNLLIIFYIKYKVVLEHIF